MLKAVGAALVVLLLSAHAAGQGEVQLSPRRYTDKLNGFSLRPPLATEQRREASPSRLVSWIYRDANTRAIAWTLSVIRLVEKKPQVDLKEYAKALAAKLRADERFQVDSAEVIQVAGKGAIDVRGVTGGVVRMWRRQVWIFALPGRFLILTISGPTSARRELEKIHETVLKTVELSDPLKTLAAETANLHRGRQFLARIAKQKMPVADQPQWFLISLKGKPVGWMIQTEKRDRQQLPTGQPSGEGLLVRTWTMMKLPDAALRLQWRTLFSTPDGRFERWQEALQIGEGGRARLLREDGVKQHDLIVCTFMEKGQHDRVIKKTIPRDPNQPRETRLPYLPRAIGMVLPRLLDMGKPAAYAFGTYSSEINDFELRTITVIGPQKISLGVRRVDAVHATDVVGANEELATEWWVDAKGLLLRMNTAGELKIESSSREEIVKQVPAAEKYIAEAMREK
ncbi:MAG TPA: hypothetical protein VNA25_17420 [Phycisphaerae bacterium]|nr:hypothetical protein [Phycisphaerae bacterium]